MMLNTYHMSHDRVLVPSGKFIYEEDGYTVDVDWARNIIVSFRWDNASTGVALELRQSVVQSFENKFLIK